MTDGMEQSSPEVGDEINYRSMEGCTVATVEEVEDDSLILDNGYRVPERAVLDILERNSDAETNPPGGGGR